MDCGTLTVGTFYPSWLVSLAKNLVVAYLSDKLIQEFLGNPKSTFKPLAGMGVCIPSELLEFCSQLAT